MSNVTIMFNISESFNDALDKFVGEANEARAAIVRTAVAKYIKYDLKSEPAVTRKSKYATPEERKAAQKARAKKRRELTSKLLKAYESEDSEAAIKALMESLKEVDAEDQEDAAEDTTEA